MRGEKPKEEASVYKVLSNPHRRRIIEVIGPEGKASFTELRKDLGMSVGALYHHLDSLGGLITQDDQHKYVLTQQGKEAYRLMNETTDRFSFESSFGENGLVRFHDLFQESRKYSFQEGYYSQYLTSLFYTFL